VRRVMLRVRHLMMRDAIGMQFIRGNLRPSVVLGGVHRHMMRDAISMHSECVVTGGAERRVRPSMVAAFGQTGAGRMLT